jgi:hypothetical protein
VLRVPQFVGLLDGAMALPGSEVKSHSEYAAVRVFRAFCNARAARAQGDMRAGDTPAACK